MLFSKLKFHTPVVSNVSSLTEEYCAFARLYRMSDLTPDRLHEYYYMTTPDRRHEWDNTITLIVILHYQRL